MAFPSYHELLQERESNLSYQLEQALRLANSRGEDYHDFYRLHYRAQDELKALGYTLDSCRTAPSPEQPYGAVFVRITLDPDYSCDTDSTLEYLEPAGEYRIK